VVQGQPQSSSRGFRPLGDQIPQKLKRYGDWGVSLVPDLI